MFWERHRGRTKYLPDRDRRSAVSRALLPVALLGAVLVLGGCLSGAPTPSDTPSPTPGTTCPYVLTVDEAGAAGGERIDYANLSADRQREFDRARERGEYELGDSLPETWSSPRIVEYEGTEYHVSAYVC